jgi:hypothetical protein
MGNGTAPLQPQEVNDASDRLTYLALTDPSLRPVQSCKSLHIAVEYGLKVKDPNGSLHISNVEQHPRSHETPNTFRKYDAVGPEKISMFRLLEKFAKFQGRVPFRYVHIGYNNMEEILNIVSFGNMNRQFLSLLRSEQEAHSPVIGDYNTWANLLGSESKMLTLDDAFLSRSIGKDGDSSMPRRIFPYYIVLKLIVLNPRVIWPGIKLSHEILRSYFKQRFGN